MFAALKLSKLAEQRVEMRNLKLSLQVKKNELRIHNGNVLEVKMMFWEKNLRP